METRRSYVIFNGRSRGTRPPTAGRHRAGAPGTTARYPAGPPRRPDGRRPRHLRASRRPISAVRSAGLVVLLGAAAVSSWFAAAGAAAFAQMTQP